MASGFADVPMFQYNMLSSKTSTNNKTSNRSILNAIGIRNTHFQTIIMFLLM